MNADRPEDSSSVPVRETVDVVRTFLEMDRPELLVRGPEPTTRASVQELDPCSIVEWRALYRQVGRAWHWHDRDAWSDERLAAHLDADNVRVFRAFIDMPDGH